MATLMYGSQGNDVLKLQKALNQNGYSLKEDGIYGNETKNAVLRYQKENGLVIDGIVGTATWSSLNKAVQNLNAKNAAPTYTAYEAPEFKVSDATSAAETAKKNAESAVTNHGDFSYDKQGDLDTLLNNILNRKEFSYDLNGDALYQQYKDKYIQQGKLAMGDAIGQASAMTGGYGNSYAQSVGQQAYQAQLQNLNDIVPELYQMALDKYNREGEDLYNQYGLLSNDKNTEYGMWADEYNRLVADREYASGDYYNKYGIDLDKYNTDVGIGQSEHQNAFNAAYQKWADAQNQANWEKEYALNERQVALQEKQYADSEKTSSSGGSSSSSSSSSKSSSLGNTTKTGTKYESSGMKYQSSNMGTFTGSTFEEAKSYLKARGISADRVMNSTDWHKHRNSYMATGQGGAEVRSYSSYEEYLQGIVGFLLSGN